MSSSKNNFNKINNTKHSNHVSGQSLDFSEGGVLEDFFNRIFMSPFCHTCLSYETVYSHKIFSTRFFFSVMNLFKRSSSPENQMTRSSKMLQYTCNTIIKYNINQK